MRAEYKQVTVLFADVVRSMDMAYTLGAERLREIMAEVFGCSSMVVERYGGTIDKFTGDGLMAVFGAPVALEDHAFRACLASLDIQHEVERCAVDVERRDGIALRLRIGLNSGEVVAGEIGTGPSSYTTIGEQVGLAQRMESVAPPGGVMLSQSTASLVAGVATLGDAESVRIKNVATPVIARRLLTVRSTRGRRSRQLSTLVGRDWELSSIVGVLDQLVEGRGRVVGVVGPPGIGKSRLVAEAVSAAEGRGIKVFTTYCESHTREISFHVVARLLRDVFEIEHVADDAARAAVKTRLVDADAEDLLLLNDLLGIPDSEVGLPDIDPDARRRRISALLSAAALARSAPTVYVLEDAHWIDQVSESMIAEFGAVIGRSRSLLLFTFRPEYDGLLNRLPSSQRIALAPLFDSESVVLATELLGSDASVTPLVQQITATAAGNPFFAEELVRDLAERGVVDGTPGTYRCAVDSAIIRVPASLQAVIAARIDRLTLTSKRLLNAAAVIGHRFDASLLVALVDVAGVDDLLKAELIDQVAFTPRAVYAFRHPLIRTVAYESQLRSDRVRLHERLAAALEGMNTADENAALIAEHFEAAGDMGSAYDWHMRAAASAASRDIRASRTSWERARRAADLLSSDRPDTIPMRIAPRMLLCANAWREWGGSTDGLFAELSELCVGSADAVSRVIGMAGRVTALIFEDRFAEASRVASDLVDSTDTIGDPSLALATLPAASNAKLQSGEPIEGLRLAQRTIELAEGDATRGGIFLGSPLAFAMTLRGANRLCLGISGWRADFDAAIEMSRGLDATTYAAGILFKYAFPIHNGASRTDEVALRDSAEAVSASERASDDFALGATQLARGMVLIDQPPSRRAEALDWLDRYRQTAARQRVSVDWVRWVDTELVKEKLRRGDVDGAVELARKNCDAMFACGEMTSRGPAVSALVEALMKRGTARDRAEARFAVDGLAAVPTDPGYVLHVLPLLRLRALLAEADGNEAEYVDYRDRYRVMANDLGFEGHMSVAAAMK
ncbi:MAG: adenylate/guanylate cyclase domain-containing protein [Mycobacterium sp.]